MKKALLCTAAALLVVSGSAMAQRADQPGHKSPAPGSNIEAVSAAQDAVAGMVGTVSAEMTTTTQGFATAAAISDMYEVAAGKAALQRAASPAVKDFAQKMIDAHTQSSAKLKSLVSNGKTKVKLPEHVDNRRQGMLDNLRGASKADFDHRYMTQQVAAHREADRLMQGYAEDGDNAAIRGFARETGKHVKMHLDMAEKLHGKSRTASR